MNNSVHNNVWKYSLLLLVVLSLVFFIYFNDPLKSDVAPKCWFKVMTGLSCPGCGLQRCVFSLLHGDFISAIHFNLFLAIGIPYLLLIVFADVFHVRYFDFSLQTKMAYLYILLYFLWFVVRNFYGI